MRLLLRLLLCVAVVGGVIAPASSAVANEVEDFYATLDDPTTDADDVRAAELDAKDAIREAYAELVEEAYDRADAMADHDAANRLVLDVRRKNTYEVTMALSNIHWAAVRSGRKVTHGRLDGDFQRASERYENLITDVRPLEAIGRTARAPRSG